MGRRTLLLIASILVAATGTALVWVYVAGADARAQSGWQPVSILRLRPRAEVGVGTPASALAALVEPVKVPSGLIPDGAMSDLRAVKGKTVTVRILGGQFLVASQFAVPKADVAPGMLGVEVPMAEPNRAADLLHPGSLVGVYYVTGGDGAKGGSSKAQLLIPRVKVIGVGGRTAEGASNGTSRSGSAGLVSLELTGPAASHLILASQTGTLYFVVLGENVDPSTLPPVTTVDQLGQPVTTPVASPAPSLVPSPVPANS